MLLKTFRFMLLALSGFLLISFLRLEQNQPEKNRLIGTKAETVTSQNDANLKSETVNDTFETAIVNALASQGNNDPTITATVDNLRTLQQNSPTLLMRYLTISPAWKVFRKQGEDILAIRRWKMGQQWRYTIHGYYSKDNISDNLENSQIPYFQTQFIIGLSGKPWIHKLNRTTQLQANERKKLFLSTKSSGHLGSRAIITVDDLIVEIYEASASRERRLTKTSLTYLEQELEPLIKQPTEITLRESLPSDSIRQGSWSLDIRSSFPSSQPGIYDSEIWINPGEPGYIYLKAFDVAQGTPLSEKHLQSTTNERVGWSNNPKELFFSNAHFTIYEGEWGDPYDVRFEVWFVPDSGEVERKLFAKIFTIEGWSR